MNVLIEETSIQIPRAKLTQSVYLNNQIQQISSIITSIQKSPDGFGQLLNIGITGQQKKPILPKGASQRKSLIFILEKKLKIFKILFLNGSVGTGKSTVALLLENKIGGNWNWFNFRSIEGNQIANFLSQINFIIENNELKPMIILDDFNIMRYYKLCSLQLYLLLLKIKNDNGYVIVTSQKESPKQLIDNLWLSEDVNYKIPYFSEDEIRELITNHDCNDKKQIENYCKIIQVTTDNGHPQLCHARVLNFQRKNWPELTINDILSPEEVEQEKWNERQSLITEIPDEKERNFIYRLSIFPGYFKKDIGISLGLVEPHVSLPGECFEILIGPWIEKIQGELYRVTPLLKGAAGEVFDPKQLRDIRIFATEAILKQKTLTPFELNDALKFAIIENSAKHLMWICHAFINDPSKMNTVIAHELSWFSYAKLKKGQRIYEKDNLIDFMLRSFQFDIAVNLENKENAIDIANRWHENIEGQDIQELKEFSGLMFYLKVLSNIEVPFKFQTIINWLISYINIFNIIWQKMQKTNDNKFILTENLLISVFEFQIARIRNVDTLADFITVIEKIGTIERKKIIEILNQSESYSSRSFLQAAWTSEIDKRHPNFQKVIEIYGNILNKSIKWGYEILTLTLYETMSIIYDEHLQETKKALDILVQARKLFGQSNVILENQYAKILYHQSKYKKALDIWDSILPESSEESKYGNFVFSKQSAGNASAYIGDWEKAAIYYQKAADSAGQLQMNVLQVGAVIDKSFALWKSKNKSRALDEIIIVMDKIYKLPDPANNLNVYMLRKKFEYMLSWMNQNLGNQFFKNFDEPKAGFASNFQVHEEIKEYPIPPHVYIWYLIAFIEENIGHDVGALEKLEEQRKECKVPYVDLLISYKKICSHFKKIQFDNLIIDYIEQCSNEQYVLKQKKNNIPVYKPNPNIQIADSEIYSEQNKSRLYYLLISATMLVIFKKGINHVPITVWENECKSKKLLNTQANEFFIKLPKIYQQDTNDLLKVMRNANASDIDRIIACLKITKENKISPDKIYYAHIFILMYFSKLEWKFLIEEVFEKIVVETWENIIKNQKFSLINPVLSIPLVEKAINSTDVGLKKVASILLNAYNMVNIKLNNGQIDQLKNISTS